MGFVLAMNMAQGDDEVFINNNVVTNKLLSVKEFINNGKFNIEIDKQSNYNFFNLQSIENSGSIEVNQNLVIENSLPPSNQNGLIETKPLKRFNNRVAGNVLFKGSETDFGFITISADEILNQGLLVSTNSNSILLKGNSIDLSRGVINIKSGADFESSLNEVGEPKYAGNLGNYLDKRLYNQGGQAVSNPTDWGIYDIYFGGGKLTTAGPVPGVYAIGSDLGVSIQTPGFQLFELVSPHNLVYNNYDLYEEPKQIKYPIDHFGAYYNWAIRGQGGFGGNAGFSRRIDRQGNVFEPHVNLRQLLSGDAQNPTVNWFAQGIFILNRNKSVIVTPKFNQNDGLYGGGIGALISHTLEIKSTVTNRVEEVNDTSTIYLISELGNVYNNNPIPMPANTQTTVSSSTGVPESFAISRSINAEHAQGLDANSSIESFPFNGSFDIINGSGNVGTFNDSREITWTTYGMRFTNLLSRLEFGTEPTTSIVGNPKVNQIQSGSVIIDSKELNLEAAKIRAEGSLKIKTDNLISSKNAILDCQNISLDVGSKDNFLIIEDLISDEVYRFGGTLEAYEATWSDTWKTNRITNPGDGENPPETEEVNVPVWFKALFLDINSSITNQVLVQSLNLKGKNILIKDRVRLVGDMGIEGESITFDNDFRVINGGKEEFRWDDQIARGILSLTNNYLLDIPGDVDMGSANKPYDSYSNNGTNLTQNLTIFSKYFNNSGLVDVHGALNLNSQYINLSDSRLNISENAIIETEFFKLRNSTNSVQGILDINAKSIMVDSSGLSTNAFVVGKGLTFDSESSAGSLLNTEFYLSAGSYKSFPIEWNSSADRGLNASGFENNRAIGKLSLTNSFLGQFSINSKGSGKALYVDKIIFEGMTEKNLETNKLEQLDIGKNTVVYFASSNLPEDKLNGLKDGKLLWVKEYAGTYSSMPVYLSGVNRSILVNKALRKSQIYDSDGDGIANGFDFEPFGDGRPKIKIEGRKLKWVGLPSSVYKVEYTNSLNSGTKWKSLVIVNNNKKYFSDLEYEIANGIIHGEGENKSVYFRISIF